METSGKRRLTPPGEKPSSRSYAPVNATPLRSDLAAATRAYVKQQAYEKRPYLKFAFANPYNLSLFAGALVASVITMTPFLALLAGGLETLWLLFAPDSKLLRRLLWDPRIDKERRAAAQQDYAQRIAALSQAERERVESLVARQQDINRLAAQNPSFTGELLRTELGKTGRLVDAFIDMAVTCARYQLYLGSVDLGGLERERRRWENVVKAGGKDDEIEIAKKNLAIVLKRFDKVKEIRHFLTIARGQLDLIENSFQLISDQIVTMQSPQELSGQLDELLDGVESIRETAADTERILNPLGLRDEVS